MRCMSEFVILYASVTDKPCECNLYLGVDWFCSDESIITASVLASRAELCSIANEGIASKTEKERDSPKDAEENLNRYPL